MRSWFVILLLAVAACQGDRNDPEPAPELVIPFRVDGVLDVLRYDDTLRTINIEIADNDSSRQRGMMQRVGFPENSGMLFVFDRAEMQQFWMGNTPVALDLLFIDSDSQVVDFSKYAVPFSDEPLATRSPAQFVLEVPAGWVDSNGIVEGDRVRWRRH